MELHTPRPGEILAGDLVKWYGWGHTQIYGVALDTPSPANEYVDVMVTSARSTHDFIPPQYTTVRLQIEGIDKLFRFNPFDRNEHGSDVAKAHIDSAEKANKLHVDFYSYANPVVHVTEG